MHRSARVLSASALAGAALSAVAPPAFAEQSADITPRAVAPGGTVTVSVSCDAISGTQPDSIEATSQGFEGGMVRLKRVNVGGGQGGGGTAGGEGTGRVMYSGTARVPAAGNGRPSDMAARDLELGVEGRCPTDPGEQERRWTESLAVNRDGSGSQRDGTGSQGEGQVQRQGGSPVGPQGENPGKPQGEGQEWQQDEGQGERPGWGQGRQQGDGQVWPH
ncbi:hypothetical protein, partial [Streptomyces sp. NPDC001020]